MTTLNISLPESLTAFVQTQVAAGHYHDASEYVQDLIRQAHQNQERAAIEVKLLAGVESLERGEGMEITPQDWERLRREYQQRLNKRNGQ